MSKLEKDNLYIKKSKEGGYYVKGLFLGKSVKFIKELKITEKDLFGILCEPLLDILNDETSLKYKQVKKDSNLYKILFLYLESRI